jgi:RNA polymerase sigma-70 factor (ECF subfamily)
MKLTNLKDRELISLYLKGNQSAIEMLISRHNQRVFTYISLLVKNQELAEDIFQETFIKVIQSLKKGKYQEQGTFVSWVVRISHNLIIDHFRKSKNLKTVSNDSVDADIFNSRKFADQNIEDEMIQTQILSDIGSLVEMLPDDQKEVVLLRHYGGLSFKEIAEQTNVSINTALGRMRYALINLRKMMKEKNITLTVI